MCVLAYVCMRVCGGICHLIICEPSPGQVLLCVGICVCMRVSMHGHVSVCVCVRGDLLCVRGGRGTCCFYFDNFHLTCEPSPGQVLLCACYGEHFIL